MKNLNFIISIFSLVALLGCQAPENSEVEVSILFDITGSSKNQILDVNTQDVYEIFELADNPFNHGLFRISTLTETHLSEIKQVKLSPVESISEYNKFSRENHIRLFLKTVDSLLQDTHESNGNKQESSLFIPISKELNRLANSQADKKVLLCFSDLFENSSSLFSVYSNNLPNSSLIHTDKLNQLLATKAPLPEDLSGIEVYIIFNPDLQTDKSFLVLSRWYKELLENKGAIVHINANFILE